jgi:hypothetical protein
MILTAMPRCFKVFNNKSFTFKNYHFYRESIYLGKEVQ